jgi:thioredoxin-related protein
MRKHQTIFQWAAWMAAALALFGSMGCSHESVQSMDLGWPTDLPAAQAQAKTEKKMVLIDFNGSDWCPDCALLAKKVFATPEFKTYAQANLALVDADFPEKTPQPAALKAANEELRKKFDIDGFPSVLVLDGDGKVLDKMSGPTPDPVQFIAHLEKLKAQVK